jgi:hypothetical protein
MLKETPCYLILNDVLFRLYTLFNIKLESACDEEDRLCGLVVRVLGYRSGGPGSIPGTTRFSEEKEKGEQ